MLKSISLENYKCFDKLDNLEIAPLTVLCGVNSSGKSSILKSLLMLKQSYEDNSVSNYILLNGKFIDNGTFKEVLLDTTKEKHFSITNHFEIKRRVSRTNADRDYTNHRDLCRLYYDNNIDNFLINYSIEIIGGEDFLYSNKISEILIEISFKNTKSKIHLQKNGKKTYSIYGVNIPDTSGQLGKFSIEECICYFSGMSLNSIYLYKNTPETKLFIPAIVSIFNIISSQYKQIQYIAPLRENPKRRYIADKEVNYVGVSGENTPLLLKRIIKNNWRGILAPKSEDDFCVTNEDILIQDKFGFILNSWMGYLELGGISLDTHQTDLIKVQINKHNIADVGFGVSQVLPILTEGLYLAPKQTLLLEQPEIHLHPKMQMKMADFLLSLSVQDKQVIVETHSDHFINRIVRRYMEDEKIRDKIKIYFIDKDVSNTSLITKVNIDEVDGALCENENFFYQFASETEKIIDAGYKNLEKKRKMQGNV